MRLFFAIELPDLVRRQLAAAQGELRRRIRHPASWTAAENLHVTLKFLGEVEETQIAAIAQAAERVRVRDFTAGVIRLGVLPCDTAPAKIITAEMAETAGQVQALANLHDKIESACEPLGFAREQRRYRPHVTLARLRNPQRIDSELAAVKLACDDPFPVREFVLMQSILRPQGSHYERLATFDLQ